MTISYRFFLQNLVCGFNFKRYPDRQVDGLPASLLSFRVTARTATALLITLPCQIKSIPSSVRCTLKLSESQTGRQADKQPV